MAILSKGTDFSTGDQVTAAKLNALVDSATFASTAVDDVSTALDGSSPKKIIVKDGGISTARLADSAVTTAKIADSNVTKAKIENVANMKALGNTSGSASAPQEVAILDEDTMSSNSATSLATQQSIKAYVDTEVTVPKVVSIAQGNSSNSLSWSGDQTNRTYTISELSINGSTGFSGRLLGIYVFCRCDSDFNQSHLPFVRYYYPVLGGQVIFRHGSDGGSQGNLRRYETMFFLPVNPDQTTLVFDTEDDGDFVSVDILGASILI